MSQYKVSALKFRPQRFDEVVGQQHVTDTLKNALKSGHLAHAFLFCGPRGVGKTTSARILGKVLNCQNRTEDFEPCNECEFCKAMNRNASFNIIEQDAASNNSVNDIRELIVHVNAAPPKGDYKVFIIDEVHMLSQSAFNAFLKTLEEPPEHAIFILATTEKHKILPTILSRCQIYDFKPIEIPAMRDYLAEISDKQDVKYEKDALHLIAQKADGALRDALSLYDRIVSATDGNVSYEAVIQNLNILDYDYFFQLTDLLLQKDTAGVLNLFHEILRKGFEPDQVILGMSQHLRDLLVSKNESITHLLEVGENIQSRYHKQAQSTDRSFLLTALQIANTCDIHYPRAKNKRLHVEIALLKMTHIHDVERFIPQVEGEVKKKARPEGRVAGNADKPEEVSKLDFDENAAGNKVKDEDENKDKVEDKKASDKKEFEVSSDSPSPSQTDPVNEKDEKLENKPKAKGKASELQNSSSAKGSGGRSSNPNPNPNSNPNKGKLRKKGSRYQAPSLRSLDDIENEIDDSKARSAQEKPEWEEKTVQAFFEKLSETANPPSTRSVLKNTEVHLKDGKLLLRVGSVVDKSTLLQETWIIQKVRDHFHKPKLQILIEIDEEKRKEGMDYNRPVSNKEMLDQMIEENPIINKLREILDLRFDK